MTVLFLNRNLLLGLYKGDNGHLTPKSEKSNSTLLVKYNINIIYILFVLNMTSRNKFPVSTMLLWSIRQKYSQN
jgi:hypothetical protein